MHLKASTTYILPKKLAEVSRPVFDVLSKNHGFIITYKSSLALRIKINLNSGTKI